MSFLQKVGRAVAVELYEQAEAFKPTSYEAETLETAADALHDALDLLKELQ